MATPWKLVPRNLFAHKVRSGLTVIAVGIAVFLLCFLHTIVTSLDRAVTEAATNRLVVQSAVSLFVNLPLDYQAKIDSVSGVAASTKMQWFGGAYQDDSNFFAQFAIDHERFFDLYDEELQIVEAPGVSSVVDENDDSARTAALAALNAERRGCIIGADLQRDFGWQVGDTIPILGRIFSKEDGSAWDFVVCGVYEPRKANVDPRSLWFRFDYLKETMVAEGAEDIGVGTFMLNLQPGADPAAVSAQVDSFFNAGPQRTTTTTEAAFQATFVNMLGNVPLFVSTIGGAVVFALLFSVINTMMMAARQRSHEAGVLKALGFSNGVIGRLFLFESVFLAFLGGALGVAFALLSSEPLRVSLGSKLPGYQVLNTTALAGLGLSLIVGLIAGIAPSLSVARTEPVEALRSEG